MARRYKRITAGPLVEEVVYNCPEPRDTHKARAEKSKLTTAARKAINHRSKTKKLELLIAANFMPQDLYVTATFRDGCLPKSRKEAMKIVQRFFDLMRKTRRLRNLVLKYIYAVEQGDGRWHVHFLVNATGNDFELIRSLWSWGDQVEFLHVGERDYETLAGYLLKELRPNGAKGWVGSTNLTRPTVETYWIKDAAVTLQTPHNCQELEYKRKSNIYGEFTYIKYLRPWPETTGKQKQNELDKPPMGDMEIAYRGTL